MVDIRGGCCYNWGMEATVSIASQIDGLRAAGAGSHPMRRGDYRRPIRAAMLRDARSALLYAHGAPVGLVASLRVMAIAEWPTQARKKVATIR